MDKTAIKNFAVWARVKLMEDIRTRLGLLGITEDGISDPMPASTNEVKYFDIGADHPVSIKGKAIHQREQLAEEIRKAGKESNYQSAYRNFIESSAYDWFNRLIAIRYMEVNEYAPLDVRLLSSVEPGKQDPDLLSTPFDGSLEYSESETQQILAWKEQHDNNKLFRFLLFKMCNQLHEVLPGIFEARDDASELLMRQSFIDKDGIIHHLVNDIPEEDWKDQVQIIGWIYQYYNTEIKDETFKLLKKNVKITKERIPSATQLFTPDWIVRYMVENSLGKLWIEHLRGLNPDVDEKETAEKFGWKYYLPEAKQEPEVEQQLAKIRKEYATLKPEDLSCADICMGSGHILVYMFDVLEQIYTSVGYSEREAAKAILENNIYGLDIDDRAYQLAYFAVMMKARQYNRRILTSGIKAHVYSIQESNGITKSQLQEMGESLSPEEKRKALSQAEKLVELFHDAKEYGSVLNIPEMDWGLLRRFSIPEETLGQTSLNWNQEASKRMLQLIDQGKVMSRKYWVTCTNPPYMTNSNMNFNMQTYLKREFPLYSIDLFACFIKKNMELLFDYGFAGFMTSYTWMFLTAFTNMRKDIFSISNIITLIQPEYHSFFSEANVPVCTFALQRISGISRQGIYIKLQDFYGQTQQQQRALYAIANDSCYYRYTFNQSFCKTIPGYALAYWLKKDAIDLYDRGELLSQYVDLRQGLITGDNDQFLRSWFECDKNNISFGDKKRKWFVYHKGGDFRKWYGNNLLVVNWENEGEEITNFRDSKGKLRSRPQNIKYYFKTGFTWSALTVANFNARYMESNSIFDAKGSSGFCHDTSQIEYFMGLCNSKVAMTFLEFLAPTMDYSAGAVGKLPVIMDNKEIEPIRALVDNNIKLSKSDWNSFEISWDFAIHPLIAYKSGAVYADVPMDEWTYRLSDAYHSWEMDAEARFNQLKKNEEELNRIFIDIYGLQNELKPEEDDKDVTVRKADLGRDIRSLISYAIGCMFGRYSLDKKGLIYAGGDFDSIYWKFKGLAPLSEDGEMPIGGGYAGISLAPYHYPKFRDSVDYEKATTLSFEPDTDNVIPITDQKYLDDDVVERICEFLTVVYGADTLEENLDFIAKALGNKGLTSREVIRNYMLNNFFKDHCKTYSVTGSGKRPIYWLFDSGKENAFKALVYMHRWDADTTGRVLIYAQQIQQKYETEIRAIDMMLDHITDARQKSTEEKRQEHLKKQLEELVDYEERLEHMANERIAIDLDDGVKVNYEKVQTDRNGKKYQILAPIK